jgi:HEAT repeat protein
MNRHILFGFCLLLVAVAGCAKGALWRLGYLSPQARQQWADEEKIAKTWPVMRDEMTGLAEQAKASSPADQQRVAKRFAEIVEKDNRMLVKLHAVKLLGELSPEAAMAAVAVAARDANADVRVAACQVYGQMATADSLMQLAQLLRSDDSEDVQIAAIRAMGQFKSPEAAVALRSALEEERPALQLAAAESLGKITGEKFGKDVPKWLDYVATLGPANSDAGSKPVQQATHQQPDEVRSFLDSIKR